MSMKQSGLRKGVVWKTRGWKPLSIEDRGAFVIRLTVPTIFLSGVPPAKLKQMQAKSTPFIPSARLSILRFNVHNVPRQVSARSTCS